MPVSGVPAGPGSPAGATTGPAEPAADAGDRTTPPGRPARPALGARWLVRAAAVVLAAAVLFVCYWRQSLTQPISSDGAANALQVYRDVNAELERLSKRFPPGLKITVAFDTTSVVSESIREVVTTLLVGIPKSELGTRVGSLAEQQDTIMNAIDMLLSGF